MRGLVITALALAVACSAFASGKQVTVGTMSGGNWIPFWGTTYNGMRFQTLIDQSQIAYAGTINEVEYYAYYGYGGTFNNFRAYLGHTALSSLTTTFANNYKGSPVLVATASSFTIPASKNWFPLKMTTTFVYNNTDNLIVEVRWQGKAGSPRGEPIYSCRFGSGNHRVWAYNDPNASSGSADTLCYHCRLSFNYYTGVEPTSLGRVKAVFE